MISSADVDYKEVDRLSREAVEGRNSDAAWKKLQKLAENGNAEAQYRVANIYLSMFQDKDEAIKWYRKAAENGHEVSQQNIAVDLVNMEKNEEALTWIRRWAKDGRAWAESYLARLYAEGRAGLTQNYGEALKWYEKILYTHSQLPQKENANDYAEIGDLYRTGGYGIKANLVKAHACYRMAVVLNKGFGARLSTDAQTRLGVLKQELSSKEIALSDQMVEAELKGLHKIVAR